MNLNSIKKEGAPKQRSFFFFISAILILGIFFNPNIYVKKNVKDIRFIWPAELIEHLVLGYHFPVADALWLRFIQDIDFKDKNLNGKTHLGWAYHMGEAITNLDRRYRIVYMAAGTILSVGIEDAVGAQKLMEKGVVYYPKDWSLLYRLAYHFMYELKDCKKAAYYLNEAGKYGAPRWVGSLAARLYTHAAQYELAYRVILENLERFKGGDMEENLLKRKAELENAMRGGSMPNDEPNKFAAALCH